jgi:hypothetical protein
MKCIFITVFNQEKYVDMFYLLLESIIIYGNLDDNTNIIVYTSTPFMYMIKQSHLFNDKKIIFEINDTYNTVATACRSRYDAFNLSSIQNYDKILYLDTDILVKDDINKIFNLCNEDILYVVQEGYIYNKNNFWGKDLFGNEIDNYHDKTAFNTGILLFNNCEKIKDLFDNTIKIFNTKNFYLNDQPYLVYNAFKYNLYNNKILNSVAVLNDKNIHSNKVIHHFCSGPGKYRGKIDIMNKFLNNIKNFTTNNNEEASPEYYNNKIQIDKDVINDVFTEIKPNTKMLVFGLGYDSKMWYEGNNKNTFFIENQDAYIKMNTKDIPQENIIKYDYKTTVSSSFQLTDNEIADFIIPEKIMNAAPFDIIIIDGPQGFTGKKPGRLIPLYWSTIISKPGTIIYIDDANRKLENFCIQKYFKNYQSKVFEKRDKCIKIYI